MKILLNSTDFKMGGGIQRVVSIWAKMLVNQKHEVYLLTSYPSEHEYCLDKRVIRYNVACSEKKYLKTSSLKRLKEKRKILNIVKPNIIIPFYWYNNVSMVLANGKNDCVVYQTIRDNPKIYPYKRLYRLVRDFFINRNRNLILQNEEQSEYYNNKLINKHIIGNPVNPISKYYQKRFYRKIGNIISVGRLVKQKNYNFMIETMKFLIKSNKNITLSIYGEGTKKAELLMLIKDNNLENNILLKGNEANIIEIEKNYDAFLMTSLHEGFPNALLEAMSVGLPVFVTNFKTGVKELVYDGETGIIDYDCKPQSMAKLIMDNNNEDILRKIGTKAKDFVNKKYSYEEINQQLSMLIEKSK